MSKNIFERPEGESKESIPKIYRKYSASIPYCMSYDVQLIYCFWLIDDVSHVGRLASAYGPALEEKVLVTSPTPELPPGIKAFGMGKPKCVKDLKNSCTRRRVIQISHWMYTDNVRFLRSFSEKLQNFMFFV